VVVAAAPVALKQAVDIWGPPPPGFPIMRALKQALDPHAILNPGRFVGGI
jgi:glycolate oxidase FAD binding subunit